MATQTLLFTALPNGVASDGRLRVSLLLSPRLDPQSSTGSLAQFPDFTDWPATLAQATFRLRFGVGEVSIDGLDTSAGSGVDHRFGLPDSALWQAIFPENTSVSSHEFDDRSASKVLSYGTADLHERLRDLYRALAGKAGDELPSVEDLLKDSEWGSLVDDTHRLDNHYVEGAGGLRRDVGRQFKDYVEGNLPEGVEDLANFQLFHTPAGEVQVQDYSDGQGGNERPGARWRTHRKSPLPSPDELVQRYDFHQVVAAMNQYPTLLRRLGIVVDFLVERDLLPDASQEHLRGEILLPGAGAGVSRLPSISARVNARLQDDVFEAVSNASLQSEDYRLDQRLLHVADGRFDLLQVDVDGSGHKAMNTARTLWQLQYRKALLTESRRLPRRTGVPGLRNAGLMLVHRQRGVALENVFGRAKANNDQLLNHQQDLMNGVANPVPAPEFWAEDLVRGFRMDIWDSTTGHWQSLCRRTAAYEVDGQPPVMVQEEEGIVRLAATESPDPNSAPGLLWLHENVMSWTGWSLCAPQPGKRVNPDDDVDDEEARVPSGLPLRSRFAALPGSLPRLRYGRRYWVRGRAVDLAANSLPFDPGDLGSENPAQHAQPYLRYEPIRPPALALVREGGDGVLVPREGESMARLAIRTFNDEPAKNTVPATQKAGRLAVPESASVREAEYHGKLDVGGAVSPGFFQLLAEKDSPLDEEVVVSSGPLVDFHALPNTPPAESRYAVMEPGSELPYLPDPLAERIAVRIFDLPGHDENAVMSLPLYASGDYWPHASSFRIVLLEKPGEAPRWNEQSRELVVSLPKASRARLRLSVQPSEEALELMGVWHWLTPAQQSAQRDRALAGQHWMLTPWRELELVHAVQKPLITPDMEVRITREMFETHAVPNILCAVSLKSTDHVDLMAEWNEPLPDRSEGDGEGEPPPLQDNRHCTERAYGVKITPDHERYGGRPEHHIVGTDRIRAGAEGSDRVARKVHEFGDTRYRRVEYWLEATSCFREYMSADVLLEGPPSARKITDANITVSGDRGVGWIPSSAPPPAPEVLYVVPTWHWLRKREGKSHKAWRRGGGLRVYLDRPWNVTGYGEMLAVVLPGAGLAGKDPNTEPASEPAKTYVTQWGNDPVFATPYVPGTSPKLKHFPLARTGRDLEGGWLPPFAPSVEAEQPDTAFKITGLAHPKVRENADSATRVAIAPHDVGWDPDRRLWYCDIEIDHGGSYGPFVRLALARYQPISVHDAWLSDVVLADFMILTPDRWLSVTGTSSPTKRNVKVFGRSYTDNSGSEESRYAPWESVSLAPELGETPMIRKPADVASRTVVEVWVERHVSALGEDFGWEREEDAVIERTRRRGIRLAEAERRRRDRGAREARRLVAAGRPDSVLANNLVEHLVTPVLFQGSVSLPEAPSDSTRFRLVVAEYEEYLADDEAPYSPTPTEKSRRLVFVEHVELT